VDLDAEHRALVGRCTNSSSDTNESERRLTRSCRSHNVNAEVRDAIEQSGYLLSDRIVALGNSQIIKRSCAQACYCTGTGCHLPRFLLDMF
jgi:hypothetical protein